MLKKNWGRVIFISSQSGQHIPAEMIPYGMTKTASMVRAAPTSAWQMARVAHANRASHRTAQGRASRVRRGARRRGLAFTPCASDAEFLEKLRYLYAQQAKIWDLPDNRDNYGCLAIAAAVTSVR